MVVSGGVMGWGLTKPDDEKSNLGKSGIHAETGMAFLECESRFANHRTQWGGSTTLVVHWAFGLQLHK